MKNGITKGYLNHKISNDSSKGYNELKIKLLDDKIDIPLRYEKLKGIITGKDEKGEELWNNGNAIRTHRKDYQKFFEKNKPELWEEICKINLEHKYREKINRQGHSNIKKSYWAIGYDTLQDFYEMSKKEDIDKYKEIHNNCCGLGVPENRIKNIKKAQRKIKRKEFRQKKKESTKNKDDKKVEDKKEKDTGIRGRGRGRGRRGYGRLRGRRRGGIKHPMVVDDDSGKKDIDIYDEDNDEINDESDVAIIGKKQKRSGKPKKKDKEDKKLTKKIKEMKKPKK